MSTAVVVANVTLVPFIRLYTAAVGAYLGSSSV